MLEKGEGKNWAKKIRLPGSLPQRFYVITPAIFES
jgi:hypothetical protein